MPLPLNYHWRNLFVRKTTTLLTVLVIAAVVGVFAWGFAFDSALQASLSTANETGKLMILRNGATSETNSAIPVEDYNKLNQLADLARDPKKNEPLLSPEMMHQLARPRKNDGGKTWGNIALRGVNEIAFRVHSKVAISEGRTFTTGAQEVIVGRAADQQFSGLTLGEKIQLGYSNNREYTVVGFFTAQGGPMESEVWGYLPSLMNAYYRTMYSSASLRLRDGADVNAIIEQIQGPAIELTAMSEKEYWGKQTQNINVYLTVTRVLVSAMALAAVLSIANTMYSMVAGRTREVAMLRTIGFSKLAIIQGFVIEALLVCLLGGVLGCIGCLAWLNIAGSTKDMFGATSFTTLAFNIRMTPFTAGVAIFAVLFVGAFGAFLPALRASRVAVMSALREP